MNILITSISRKVSLIKAFKKALYENGGGKVIGTDTNILSIGLHIADEFIIVPMSDAPDFKDAMINICKKERIDLVIPTRDEELPFWALNKDDFLTIGTKIMIASIETIKICQNKFLFNAFCIQNSFKIPAIVSPDNCKNKSIFPLFGRPQKGKSSKNTFVINTESELNFYIKQNNDLIIQKFIDAPEYTIDLFAEFSGKIISVVPRQRINTFGGESFVTKTCKNSILIAEAIKLSERLKLIGHNTIQCFFYEGQVLFIEVNPRFGGAANLSFIAGAPSPNFLVEIINGKVIESQIGQFKDKYTMLRFTEDMFFEEKYLDNIQ